MKALTKRLLALGASSAIAVSGAYLVEPWESTKNQAYRDMVGVPTICAGYTIGVKMGDYKTDDECDELLVKELTDFNTKMMESVKVELKPYEEVAYTSFVWNVGLGAWNSSTLLRKLNAGDKEGACKQILVWNKATFDKRGADRQRASGETCTAKSNQPGKYSCTVKGLTNRRVAEYQVCTNNNADVTKALEEVSLLETDEGIVENLSPESILLDSKPLEGFKSSPPTSPLPIEGLDVSSPVSEPTSVLPCKWRLFGRCLWKGKGV